MERILANRENGEIINGLEIVASKGLYITKKRYAALIYDPEGSGTWMASPKVKKKKKAIGPDPQTAGILPSFMQDFANYYLMCLQARKRFCC